MSDDFSDVSAFEHLERVVQTHADKLALSDGTTSLTFQELLQAVQILAAVIAEAVVPGEAVGLLLGNALWYPVAMLAAMRSGRPAVPLNPRDPVPRLAAIAADAGLKAIVRVGAGEPQDWPDAVRLRWIDPAKCLAEAPPGSVVPSSSQISVDAPAIVLYTSGSTGTPKGVVNSQRALLQRVQQYVNAGHIGPDDVFMPLTGPATIAGCREMMTPMLCGATLYLLDVESAGIRAVREHFQRWRVTVAYLVPALLRVLMNGAQPDMFASLRVVRVGGERVLWADIDRLRAAVPESCFIQISYLSTESTGTQWFLPRDYPEHGATVPVGFVLPGVDYAVVDENGDPVAPGEEGELLVRSSYVALGYWERGRNLPLQESLLDPQLRVFATGDLVTVDETGLMRIVGRKGRQIKINGRRVEPAELELVLRRAPGIRDAVAVVTDTNELVAFVVPEEQPGSDLIPELRALIRRALPAAVHPTRLHSLAELPRLRGGKIDSIGLRELDRALRPPKDNDDVRDARQMGNPDAVEAVVGSLWERMLQRKGAGGSRWDEAGGDSLKLLQFVMELEEALGRELDLDLFTIDMSFADIVRAASGDEATRHPPVSSDTRPVLFIVPGSIGYGPSLAAFGLEMGKAARVVAVRYENLKDLLAGQGTIPRMVAAVVDQIKHAQPEGNVKLIGYSLGGGVAFEVASALVAAGRSVTFLGILDTNIGPGHDSYAETIARTVQRVRAHRVTIDRMMLRAVAKIFARFGAEARLARGIERLKWEILARPRFILRLELEEVLRMRAFHHWREKPKTALPIAATLFRCCRPGAPSDLGWGELFTDLNVVPIAGGHLDMLIEPHLAHNRPLIEHAFLASGG
ncbi:AMP-binding protein [Bosea sp. BIWAKO-01]|uniref:AMP-binding protein n=1 Tax=Bosea sp. BIWAKO-01 TaxID=506668 RepID=UPI000852C6D3|nr:AMP-binding protein [Bosea sp. BIWAKO-01]GAU86626.1 non-ribosomal peptide synthetase [Bosea sp. BIWAKO-01]